MREPPWLDPRRCPASNCSSSTTSRPRRASHHAVAEPMAPAPITRTSGMQRHYVGHRLPLALVAIVVVAVGLVAAPLPAGAKPVPNYVALGDSYTAGPLIPLQIAPYGCL